MLLESIIKKIEESGFSIAMSKEMHLTREQAEDFYSEHKDTEYFDTLVSNMIRYNVISLICLLIHKLKTLCSLVHLHLLSFLKYFFHFWCEYSQDMFLEFLPQ